MLSLIEHSLRVNAVFYERIFLSSLIYLLIMQIFLDDNLKLLFTYGVIMFNLLIIFIKFKHLISSISDITKYIKKN